MEPGYDVTGEPGGGADEAYTGNVEQPGCQLEGKDTEKQKDLGGNGRLDEPPRAWERLIQRQAVRKIVAGLPEDMKVCSDALLVGSACRDHRHSRQPEGQSEDQKSPLLPHRLAISTTRLSMVASIIRLACA
jgi:hypothetical protein